MNKLLIALLCICLAMPVAAFAEDKAMIGFGSAEVQDNTATLPVYVTQIPDGLADMSALTFTFVYDNSVVSMNTITDGTITGFNNDEGERIWYNQPDESVGQVLVSWIDVNGTAAITPDKTGKNNPLFYVEFEILDNSAERAFVNIEKAKITDINLVSTTNENLGTIAGVITIGASTGDDTTDDDTTDDDTTGDSTDDDDTSGGSDSSGSGSVGEGPLKPSTGNGNSGSSNSGNTGSSTGSSTGGSSGSSSGGSTGGSAGGVSGGTTVPTTPVVEKKASEIFSDVADSHWAAASVVKLNKLGIVSGDNQGRANLDNKITRAETSKLALLVNGIAVRTGLSIDAKDSADVPDWAKDFMATAIAEGIFSGYEDGTIKPTNNITRAEMVAVIIKSLDITTTADPQLTFADNGAIGWAAPYVAKAVELGFVNGYEDNTFKPANYITRAEAFAIFARVADYLGK